MIKSAREICLVNVMLDHLYCFTGGVHWRDKGWDAAFYETDCNGNYQQKTQKVGALTCSELFYGTADICNMSKPTVACDVAGNYKYFRFDS